MAKSSIEIDVDPTPAISTMKKIADTFRSAYEGLVNLFDNVDRKIVEADSWNGDAGQWDTAEAYCSACLIDVNAAAGNDEKKKEYCKLPVKAPGGSDYVDKAIMAAAGSHGIQSVKKPSGVSSEDWDAAVKKAANKIISLYGEMDKECPDAVYSLAGKEAPERAIAMSQVWDALYSQIDAAWTEGKEVFFPTDIYIDDDGSIYGVFARDGKLYRASLAVVNGELSIGEMTEVNVQHVPRCITLVIKTRTEDGAEKYRWVSVSCAAVLNKVGEIDSRNLFDSFEQGFDPDNPPIRDFFHLGEQYRTGVVDFVARDEFMLVTSGVYDDTELAQAEIKARMDDPDFWGDSISFVATQYPELVEVAEGIKIPVYNSGVLRAVSTLPVQDGASLFLRGTVKEVNRMSMSKRAYAAFLALFGGDEDAAKNWLEDNVDPQNRAIMEDPNVVARATEEVEVPPEETEPTTEPETEPVSVPAYQMEVTDEFVGRVADMLFDRINEQIAAYGVAAEELQRQNEGLTAKLDALIALSPRLEALEIQVKENHRIWKEDLPAGRVTLSLNRPRQEPETEPIEPEEETMADIASRTLATVAPY